tara:strand:+ start:196 stop:438 length:243 start_codon:yes stop_codon:yes gene_type:complete
MALQGKITTSRSLQASSAQQKVIEAKKLLLTSGQTLSGLTDVDNSLREDGSAILWDSASSTFKVLPTIENSNLKVIGGSF